jgi:hypothetical protein
VVLIELTKPLKGTQTGNVIFWLTIMLGQPMIVLLYARDYQTGMYGPWTEADSKFLFFRCRFFFCAGHPSEELYARHPSPASAATSAPLRGWGLTAQSKSKARQRDSLISEILGILAPTIFSLLRY